MNALWRISRGDAPLIVNVPHAGTSIPDDISHDLTEAGRANPDTDWHVDKLYEFAPGLGVTLMAATHSRIVVDLNRDPGGAALYPGAANTEICPTRTFHDSPIYRSGCEPDEATCAHRVAKYWQPYHQQLRIEIERVRVLHGYCVLLDAHSIVSEAARFFARRLPDLNLGTADGASCDETLAQDTFAYLSAAKGFSAVHNGRFKGGYITRYYGQPSYSVHALQLEMAQCCYIDERQPALFEAERSAALREVLKGLVARLLNWQPTRTNPLGSGRE